MKRVCGLVFAITIMTFNCCKESKDNGSLFVDDEKITSLLLEVFADSIRVAGISSAEPMDELSMLFVYYSYNNLLFLASDDFETIYFIRNDSLISKMHAVGRGPGEYFTLRCICYSTTDSILYGYEPEKHAIMCYSVPAFKYIKSIKMEDLFIRAMQYVGDNKILAVCHTDIAGNENNDGLFEISTDKSEINKIMSTNFFNTALYSYNAAFFEHDGKPGVIVSDFDNVLYEYNDNKLSKLMSFNYGKRNFPSVFFQVKESRIDSFNDMMHALMLESYSVGGQYAIMKGSNLIFWHRSKFGEFDIKQVATICDGKECKNYTFRIPGIKMEIDPDFIQSDWYSILINDSKESFIDSSEPLSPLGQKIIDAIDSQKDENPILLYFKLPFAHQAQ